MTKAFITSSFPIRLVPATGCADVVQVDEPTSDGAAPQEAESTPSNPHLENSRTETAPSLDS
jgi:hypothetical protein